MEDTLLFDLPAHGISLEGVEKELILRALREVRLEPDAGGEYLDFSRRTLIYRMEKFGLRGNADEPASAP